MAHADNDSSWQGKVNVQADEQRGENRHHLPQQQSDDASGDKQNHHRVNQRGLHGALQLYVLLDVGREALENDVQNTARLAGFDHVDVEIIEDLLELTHGSGEGGTTLDR